MARLSPPSVPDSSDDALLVKAVQRLPWAQRAVITLRHVENMNDQEVAEVLRIPHGEVPVIAERAVRSLRPFLGGDDGG